MAKVRMLYCHELMAGGSLRKAGRIEGAGAKFVDLAWHHWHRRTPYACPAAGEKTYNYWSSADGRKLCRVHEVEEVFDPAMTFAYRPTIVQRRIWKRGTGS